MSRHPRVARCSEIAANARVPFAGTVLAGRSKAPPERGRSVNQGVFDYLMRNWLDDAGPALAQYDAAGRGRRGPAGQMPVAALLVAKIYSVMTGRSGTMTGAVDVLREEFDRAALARVGLTQPPSYREARTCLDRLASRVIRSDEAGLPQRLQAYLDAVVVPSARTGQAADMRVVDTTLFRAHCRERGCRVVESPPASAAPSGFDPAGDDDDGAAPALVLDLGTKPSALLQAAAVADGTSDAEAAVPRRCSCDPDAAWRTIARPGDGRTKSVLGYAAVAVGRVQNDGNVICERVALLPANHNDVPVAADLILGLPDFGAEFAIDGVRTVCDRAFNNQVVAFLDPLRAANVPLSFDLKSTDHQVGDYRGTLLIDGMLYAHSLPVRLRELPRPATTAPAAEWSAWRANIAERARHAFLPNGLPGTASVRLHSPANPKRARVVCGSVACSRGNGAGLPRCRTRHAAGEGCGLLNLLWTAQMAPRTWQFPIWGSPDWEAIYNERGAIERYFSGLKSPFGSRWLPGFWPLRGLHKVGVDLGVAIAARNLQLGYRAVRASRAAA